MNVVVLSPIHADGLALLQEHAALEATVLTDLLEAERSQALSRAESIVVRTQVLDARTLDPVTGLRFVAKHGVGCDNIDLDYCARRGVPVVNTPGANTNAVAEHTIAMMLSAARRLGESDALVRSFMAPSRQQQDDWGSGSFGELFGKRHLIVGYGAIGARVSALSAAFGTRVEIAQHASTDARAVADGHTLVELKAGLAQADYVSLHVPLSSETRHMIDAEALGLMKASCVLVSVARGGAIDEQALAEALGDKRLGFACLDVFEQEPPQPGPLSDAPNTLFSPHVAALSDRATRQMAVDAALNIIAFVEGSLDRARVVNRAALAQAEAQTSA